MLFLSLSAALRALGDFAVFAGAIGSDVRSEETFRATPALCCSTRAHHPSLYTSEISARGDDALFSLLCYGTICHHGTFSHQADKMCSNAAAIVPLDRAAIVPFELGYQYMIYVLEMHREREREGGRERESVHV